MFSLLFTFLCASVISLGCAIDCSNGEVSCSSLKAAKTCDALPQCKNVWKNTVLSKDNDDVCTFCETIVGDIRNMLTNKDTEEQIKQFLISACSVIPSEALQQECDDVANNYLPELLELISEELDPSLVCSTMGLCQTSSIFKMIEIETAPVTKVTGDICADCKAFFGDIKAEITSNATEQQIIDMINQEFCSYLGELESTCEDLVAEYVPEIMQMIAQQYDPAMDCAVLGFCSQTAESRLVLPTLRLQRSPLFRATKGKSDEFCEDCKEAVAEVKSMITNPDVESEITKVLSGLCAKIGSFSEECQEMVMDYLPMIIEIISSQLDPAADCQAIGLCSSVQTKEMPLIDMVPAKQITQNDLEAFRESGPKMTKVALTAECVLCEAVMREIFQLLGENTTEAAIIGALDKVCSILPDTLAEECEDFVNNYGPGILVLIEDELNGDEICKALGLCPNKTIVVKKPYVQGDESCLVCETLVQYADSLLSENATEQEIEQVLDKVCNYLPDSFVEECTQIVNQYTDTLIKLLEKDLTPTEICTDLGLCSSETIQPVKQPMLGAKECSWGPSYWCASEENANKCNAKEHCRRHVWN